MRRLLCTVLLLTACGGSDEAEGPAAAPAVAASGAWGFGECSARCERMKGQLVRDFAVTGPIDCWGSELFTAPSLCACHAVFERRWGLVAFDSGCPRVTGR